MPKGNPKKGTTVETIGSISEFKGSEVWVFKSLGYRASGLRWGSEFRGSEDAVLRFRVLGFGGTYSEFVPGHSVIFR